MSILAETRPGVDTEIAQPGAISSEVFWPLRAKKPLNAEGITLRFPQVSTQLQNYQEDLSVFLSQEPVISSCEEISDLQKEAQSLEEFFISHLQEYRNNLVELTTKQKGLDLAEKEKRREIENNKEQWRVILGRTRVKLSDPSRRRLLGKVLARFAIETHPLLKPIAQERDQLSKQVEAIEQGKQTLGKDYEEKLTPLREAENQEQENLTKSFNVWVTENPERLLAHLLQFPQETFPLRREFHRRFSESINVCKEFDESLRRHGLLYKVPTARETQTTVTSQSTIKLPRKEEGLDKKWGVVFPDNPGTVIREREEIQKILGEVLKGKGCPPGQIESAVRTFWTFITDPGKSPKVGVTEGESVRDELGKFKIDLTNTWRAFFDHSTEGPVIEINAIMSHGEWDKKQG